MKLVFGICSWGLGHATRTLPIIRKFVKEGDDVKIVSHGRALELLRSELGESASYVELEDYQPPKTLNPRILALNTFLNAPQYITSMDREHRFVRRLLLSEKVDIIFSDNRFGFYALNVPSFYMTHQLRLMNPLRSKKLESGSERFNLWFLNRFKGILVPDYRENGLSGRLSHGLSVIDEDDLSYVGPLSDFRYQDVEQDIDLLVSISGFEPHRTAFEKIVMEKLSTLEGRVVVSLGRPAETVVKENVKVQGIVSREDQESLLNRAKLVVARSGYSTVMDLHALGKKAILVPTPGQTEQEYLASYHMAMGNFFCVHQDQLDIKKQARDTLLRKYPVRQHSTDKSIENAVGLMTGTGKAS
jgi:uncharacterized protein (TIGR00661 family)